MKPIALIENNLKKQLIFISKSYILSQPEFSYIIKPKVIFTIHKSLLLIPCCDKLWVFGYFHLFYSCKKLFGKYYFKVTDIIKLKVKLVITGKHYLKAIAC